MVVTDERDVTDLSDLFNDDMPSIRVLPRRKKQQKQYLYREEPAAKQYLSREDDDDDDEYEEEGHMEEQYKHGKKNKKCGRQSRVHPGDHNCVDVMNHIKICPICAPLYHRTSEPNHSHIHRRIEDINRKMLFMMIVLLVINLLIMFRLLL